MTTLQRQKRGKTKQNNNKEEEQQKTPQVWRVPSPIDLEFSSAELWIREYHQNQMFCVFLLSNFACKKATYF